MKNRSAVKVTVCIPTYNSEVYLEEAIESVISQEFKDYELIIVDNCSTDSTCSIIEKYIKKYPALRFYQNPKNLGMVGNFNKCIGHSRGEYVKFLLSDDFFADKRTLSRFVNIVETYPGVSLISSARKVVDSESKIVKNYINYDEGHYEFGEEIIKECLFYSKNKIGEPTSVMFRRDQALRGFDDRYKQLLDLEMWFHLLEQGSFYYIDEPLVSFRVHPEQTTQKNKADLSYVDDDFRLINEYSGKPYVKFSKIIRFILLFKQCERLRKRYKKQVITARFLNRKIDECFGRVPYAALIPVFKFAKNVLRIKFLR